MKKFMIALLAIGLVFLFTQCAPEQDDKTVILSGKIENPSTESVIFSIDKYPDGATLDTAYLDADGYFHSSFELCSCKPVLMNDGKEVAHLYLCPGDSVYITLDTEEFDETIQYTGPGAEKSSLLAEFYLKFEDYSNEDRVIFYDIRDTAIQIYYELVEEVAEDAEAFYKEKIAEHLFPDAFHTYLQTKLYYSRIANFRLIAGGKDTDTAGEYKQVKDQIRSIVLNAGQYENPDPLCKEYLAWIKYGLPSTLASEVRKEMEEFTMKDYDSIMNTRIQEYLKPAEFKNYILAKAAMYSESYSVTYVENLKHWIDHYYQDSEIQEEIGDMYDKMMAKLSKPLPEGAELYNLDDEDLLSLSFDDVLAKYRGNVIYLDFWASWCGPCKAEMPNSAMLADKLAEEDVVFLYVSTDKDADAWVNMIRIMQLHGIHYRLGANTRTPVFETFDIQYIPHYVLFDKEGNMVKNKMSRPGTAETEEKIRELL